MELLFVSSNESKFAEVVHVLQPEIELKGAYCDFVEDSDLTIEQVAAEKAKQAFAKFRVPLIVEDTGVFFEAYKNFPGAIAKRVYNAIGPQGLLKLLEGKTRSAFFETVIAFTNGTQTQVFAGKTSGVISDSVAPKNDRAKFGYERIFVPAGHDRRLCEFDLSEKNVFSHRAKAAKAFKEWFLSK